MLLISFFIFLFGLKSLFYFRVVLPYIDLCFIYLYPGTIFQLYDQKIFTHHTISIQRHTLQDLPHFTHTSPIYTQTSFQNNHPKNDVPTSVQSYVHIAYLSCISLIPNSFTLSCACLTPRVQTVSFMAHASICTNIPARFFVFSFQKG